MTNFKIRAILQGTAKYRDGKKWKKRYCLLALSPGPSDALHLYVTKSYDDFNPYRNNRCLIDVEPPTQKGCTYQHLTVPNESSQGLPPDHDLKESSPQSRLLDVPKPLINTAAHSCLLAAEATANGLSVATHLASRLNAPSPVDEITGFESGCHLDKESNVIVLIGITSVHIIALEAFDEMFRWATAMTQIMTDSQFRVTLRKSSEGSKLSQGTQGSLHVQHWRLCLIGEPMAGCKFLCSWKLDSIENAYTMTLPANASSKTGASESQYGTRWSFAGDMSQRMSSSGSISGPSGHMATGGSQTAKPKHSFILEASNSAGKGRGTHTFELEGGSLKELTTVLEQFMARRYFPDRGISHDASKNDSGASSDRGFATDSSYGMPCSTTTAAHSQQPQLSSSPDGWGSRHSVSPAQQFARIQPRIPTQPSPLSMPIGFATYGLEPNIFGRSAQTLPSSRFTNPCRFYSNLIPCTSSLSPPDLLSGTGKHSENSVTNVGHKHSEADLVDCSRSPFFDFSQRSTELPVESGLSCEEMTGVGDASQVQVIPASETTATPIDCTSTLPANWDSTSAATSSLSRKSLGPRSIASYAPSLRTYLTDSSDANDETQVARVAAGLVIPKILASPWTPNSMRLRHPPVSTQPPLLSSKGLLRRSDCAAPNVCFTQPEQLRASISEPNPSYSQSGASRSLPTPHQMCSYKPPPSTRPSDQRRDMAVKPQVASGTSRPHNTAQINETGCCFSQQGVFTADEDLWDSEQCDPSRADPTADTALERLSGHSKYSTANQHVPQTTSKPFSPKSSVACPWCRRKKHFSDRVAYQVYRHRCQQYRVCWCHTYVGRSLSADALLLLEMIVSGQSERLPSACQPPTGRDEQPLPVEARFPFESVGTQLMTCFPRYSTNPTSRQVISKTCSGIRWKQFHRLFHRKQSKSHDNIDHECHCVGNQDVDKKPVLSSSLTDAELSYPVGDFDFKSHGMDSRIQTDVDARSSTSKQRPPRLFMHCPRHGFIFYPSLVQSILNSPTRIPLCSRCRKRKRRPRVYHTFDCVTGVKTDPPSAVAADHSSAVTVASVSTALRTLASLRQKSRGSGASITKLGASRKTSTANKDSHARVALTQPVPEGVEFEIRRPSVHSVQSSVDASSSRQPARSQYQRSCDPHQHLRYQRKAHSALSLTSLPCSEPALSRLCIPFGRISEFDPRSSRSSLSSLLTFRSISGSSSLLSACHVSGHGKKLNADSPLQQNLEARGLQPRDLLEELGNCSLCDTDDLSSGSVSACYEDPCFLHERHIPETSRTELATPQSPVQRRSDGLSNPTCIQECMAILGRDNTRPAWVPANNYPSSDQAILNFSHSVTDSTYLPPSHAQSTKRANTLPNTKMFRSNSERKSSDPKVVPPSGGAHSKVRSSKDTKTLSRTMQSTMGFDRFLPRFTRKSRFNTRYNTASIVSNTPSSMRLTRKLSSQSDLGVGSHSFDDLGGTVPASNQPCPESTSYCNVTPMQHSSANFRVALTKQDNRYNNTKAQPPRSHQHDPTETTPNLYVNLAIATSTSSSHSCCSRSGQGVPPRKSSSNKGNTPPTSGTTEPPLQSSSLPNRTNVNEPRPIRTIPVVHSPVLECGSNSFGDQGYPLHLSTGMGTSDFSNIPAEVRDPSRNYAMVDLRPSPASSSHAHTELTVSSVHHSAQQSTLRFCDPTSTASSTGSTIAFSNNASTGSDCTSDAATLVSDTMSSYVPVCPVTTGSEHNTGSSLSFNPNSLMSFNEPSRRRHSHSLSLAVSEAPILNYVDVITSTAPFSTPDSTRLVDPSALSDPSGSSIPEHTDSLSSSSGLGGIASQSITPPLAPGVSASFGDIFTSRSMTSSATSSGEGVTVDPGFHSCSPPDSNTVAYTQIDITRTMALEQLRGDMEQDNIHTGNKQPGTTSGTQSHPWGSSKSDRSTSVRKTLSRPIRSIRRGNQKKTGGFFS